MAVDMVNAITTMSKELQTGVGPLIAYSAYFFGFIMVMVSLHHFVKASESHGQQHEMKGAWWGLVIGALLLSFQHTLDMLAESLHFGSSSLAYGAAQSGSPAIQGAFVIIQTLGLVVIIKSLFVFHKISKGQQSQHTMQQAFGWLIFGGAAFQAKNTVIMLAGTIGMGSEVSSLIK